MLIGGSSAISTSTDTSSSLPSGELRASESSSSGALAHGSGPGERVIGSTWLDTTAPLSTVVARYPPEVAVEVAHGVPSGVARVSVQFSVFWLGYGRTIVAIEAVTVDPGVRVTR